MDYSQGNTPNIPVWLQMLGQRMQRPQYGSASPVRPTQPATNNNQSQNPYGGSQFGGQANPGSGSNAPLTLGANGISFTDQNNPLKKLLGPIGAALGGLFGASGDYSGNPPLQASGSIPGAVGPTSIGGAPLVSPQPQASVPMPQPRPAVSPAAASVIGSNSYGTPPVQPLLSNSGQPQSAVQPTQSMPPVQGLDSTSSQPTDVSSQAAALGIPPSAIVGSGYKQPSPSDILQSILSAQALGAG